MLPRYIIFPQQNLILCISILLKAFTSVFNKDISTVFNMLHCFTNYRNLYRDGDTNHIFMSAFDSVCVEIAFNLCGGGGRGGGVGGWNSFFMPYISYPC